MVAVSPSASKRQPVRDGAGGVLGDGKAGLADHVLEQGLEMAISSAPLTAGRLG